MGMMWHTNKMMTISMKKKPGFHCFKQLADLFCGYKIRNGTNRKCLSTTSELIISKRLESMHGLQVKGRFSPKQIYQGDRPLDFAEIKSLYVHLSDINE